MNPQQVWQTQAIEAPRISLAYVRHRTAALTRRVLWRNALEYSACALALVLAAWQAWDYGLNQARPIMAAGLAWFALWYVYYVIRWHRHAGLPEAPLAGGVLDSLRYQREQLERQRDVRHESWRWWGPTVTPGFVLVLTSMIVESRPVPWGEIFLFVLWVSVAISLAMAFVARERRRIQREIDALDSLISD
jgi:hypothetical protein